MVVMAEAPAVGPTVGGGAAVTALDEGVGTSVGVAVICGTGVTVGAMERVVHATISRATPAATAIATTGRCPLLDLPQVIMNVLQGRWPEPLVAK